MLHLALLNREPLDNDLLNLKLIAVCCLAVASQFVIAFGAESMEINSAFSSFMEMGSRSIKGTILSAVTINFSSGSTLSLCDIFGTKSERNNAFVIFAVTLTLSLYALRFWNSPQHFAGHIIISAPCVAYLSKVLFDRVPITKFIFVLLIGLVPHHYFFAMGDLDEFPKVQSLTHNAVEIGDPIQFRLADDMESKRRDIRSNQKVCQRKISLGSGRFLSSPGKTVFGDLPQFAFKPADI